jgi:hypothetical protein
MVHRRLQLAATLALVLAGASAGQVTRVATQSPRQAVIEMMSGSEASFKKHLTVEMQNRLQNLMKGSLDSPSPLQVFTGTTTSGGNNFQSFDMGPILFSFNNPQEHERYEIQIDSDLLGVDQDKMALSLHLVRNGVEQETPLAFRLVLDLKRQEGTWRLNTVTVNATLPVGDPGILEKSWWNSMLLAFTGKAVDSSTAMLPVVVDDRPKMSPLRTVRMISMAENIYAQQHPGLGYTCTLADLVNVGKGMDEEGMYKFMDADIADGRYNGYRFALSGCDRKPARLFRITAEPLTGPGRAYCSDNTNNLRASDDGRGSTCLLSGKVARR